MSKQERASGVRQLLDRLMALSDGPFGKPARALLMRAGRTGGTLFRRQSAAARSMERVAALIEPEFYVRQVKAVLSETIPAGDAVRHYMSEGFRHRDLWPNSLFDPRHYEAQLPDPAKVDTTFLQHYVEKGAAAGYDPSVLFSTSFYLEANPDVATASVNPLEHFLKWGMHEGWRQTIDDQSPDYDRLLGRALEAIPDHPYALSLLGQLRVSQHRYQEALEVFQKIEGPSTPIIVLTAITMARLGRHMEATDTLLSHEDSIPEHLQWIAAETFYSSGRAEESVRLYKKLGFYSKDVVYENLRLTNVETACSETGSRFAPHLDVRDIAPPDLRFVRAPERLKSEQGSLIAPSFYEATLRDVLAFPRCNLLILPDRAVYDLAAHEMGHRADLGDVFLSERLIVARQVDKVLIRQPKAIPRRTSNGCMMFGRQSQNYGHWVLEFLPKMLVFDKVEGDFPIYVDQGMPASHYQSLSLMNTRRREVIEIPPDQTLLFDEVLLAPVPAFFPCDTVDGITYDTVWPSDVFAELRTKLLEGMELPVGGRSGDGGRRIFISRSAHAQRRMLNEDEVRSFLEQRGFETIRPEDFSFREQARLFNEASVVIGSCSSALTNGLFSRPGARYVGLIHDVANFNFRGYASFIESSGSNIVFLQGRAQRAAGIHPLHSDYVIAIEDLQKSVDWALGGCASFA